MSNQNQTETIDKIKKSLLTYLSKAHRHLEKNSPDEFREFQGLYWRLRSELTTRRYHPLPKQEMVKSEK